MSRITRHRRNRLARAVVAVIVMGVTGFLQADAAPEKKLPAALKLATGNAAPVAKVDALELAKLIDRHVQLRLDEDGIKPSPVADDAEFLRRAYLDIIGVIPPAEKVKEFLDSADPAKRSKAIDELLAHPRYGAYLGEMWSGQMLPIESNNRRLTFAPMQKWLADAFSRNVPWNKLVYDLLTATGQQNENGAVTYFIANPTLDKITDNVSKMFLGLRLQCAQCHNHPFVEIKQNDYWGMAAFFGKVRPTANPKQAAKKGGPIGIFEVANAPKGRRIPLPESAKIVPARFLLSEQPKLDSTQPYRPVLAKWLTAPENPYFAKAMVNRTWHQLFGRGIVKPMDDMHDGNPPTHPELLSTLTEQFKANDFDLKYLIRAICNSQTYQRTSKPFENNKGDKELFSHAGVRALSPEQLYDSLAVIVGEARRLGGDKRKGAAGLLRAAGTPRDAFLAFFRIEGGADPMEYQAGIPQALRLMNSAQSAGTATLDRIMAKTQSPELTIEQLFLAVLSRRPTDQEVQRFGQYVAQQDNPRTGYSDVLWAVLNSSEFALNH